MEAIAEIKEEIVDPETAQKIINDVTNGSESKDVVFSGKVVQITNVSPGATLQQMATLFGFLGTVTDIRLYPTEYVQNCL